MDYTCPVCGFTGLTAPPRSPRTGGASDEICPSCGFQFGFSDDDRGYTYETWRDDWIRRGMPWSGIGQAPPANWNPKLQLKALLER
jgi:hypothetical protein